MSDTGKMILIGVPLNLADVATTLSMNSAEATLPTTNLQTQDPKEVARTTGLINVTIDFRRLSGAGLGGGAHNFEALALVNHNMGTTATFSVRCSTSTAFAGGSDHVSSTSLWLNSTDVNVLGIGQGNYSRGLRGLGTRDLVWLSTATVGLDKIYTRLYLNDTASSDGYTQAGRLISGPTYEITGINFQTGWSFETRDRSAVQLTPNGTLYADERPFQRVVSCNFRALTENVAFTEVMHDLWRQNGLTRGFYVIFQPNTTELWHEQAFYSRLSVNPKFNRMPTPGSAPRFEVALTFEEML